MSLRELTMTDVKEVLRRWQAGQSARQMAREAMVSRRTAARYIDAAKEVGLSPVSELTDAAWRFFGGITKRVALDDVSAAVVRTDAKDPGINPSFAEYAQARGFFVDPARVRHPQDKARVENQVS